LNQWNAAPDGCEVGGRVVQGDPLGCGREIADAGQRLGGAQHRQRRVDGDDSIG
jgi:hypothetical protein